MASQKLRNGDGFTPVIPLYIEGDDKAYTKPIYILTSQQTASAAEAFSIATMSMKNAKRIGSASFNRLRKNAPKWLAICYFQ